jgi:hypothetical protein
MQRTAPFFLLLCLLICSFGDSRAQQTVKGSVTDTLNMARLEHASVSLIRAEDSVLATFGRTDSSGRFSLSPDSAGKYILLVAYPGFADYIDVILVNEAKTIELGDIPMISSTHLLTEFVLKKRASAMLIKGDTTEYNADSFAVRPGATVEELLKKLPGIQVDKDGKITAQGEQVQKVLVDGEEFFSDDPAVVTKNLQSATVDKVQVFDKKSDEAAFTGIDDGEKTKTINLLLKEDKKRGMFGKAAAAGGTDGYFENQAMINAFKGKRQLSAFGIMSNTGTVGLGWEDRDKYGSGNQRSFDEESGMMYSYSSSDEDDDLSGSWNGRYSGQGLPTVWTGGLHYANKWGGDKQHISGNYRYSKNNIETEGSSTTQYVLPNDSGYVRSQNQSTFSTGQRHGGDGMYEWTIDSTSSLRLTASGGYIERASNGSYHAETRGMSGGLINTSDRSTSSASSSESMNATLNYRKKFKKKGRSMNGEIRESYRSSEGTGYLLSENVFYNNVDTQQARIDQLKRNTGTALTVSSRLSYTEPLSKVAFLTFRYGLNITNNGSERLSFNRGGADWSTTPDSLYSSSYDYDMLTHNGAATLRFVLKKYNISVGGEVFNTSWQQYDRLRNTTQRRSFNNYAPSASIRYSFSKQSNLSLQYNGSTQQPTLDQLQPLQQNTDPLNISVGNPDLRQEFRNSLSLNYHSYKPLSGVWSYFGGSVNTVIDDISRSERTDEAGRRTYQYVNVDGNYYANFWGGYGTKFKGPGISANLNGSFNLYRMANYVNDQLNISNNNSYSIGIDLNKEWQKDNKTVVDISLEPDISYYDNRSTISTFSTSYWTARINANMFVQLPWKLSVRTDISWNLREQTDIFNRNNNVIRWNASLGRKFLKGDKLELRANVYDILNQNLGYTRDAQGAYITESRYNTIRRYGMLNLIWVFSKGPDTKTPGTDED